MEDDVKVKGVGLRLLIKDFVEPDDTEMEQEEQETVETSMGTVWVKVWNHLDKWGKDITEKGVTLSKGSKKVARVKASQLKNNPSLENEISGKVRGNEGKGERE